MWKISLILSFALIVTGGLLLQDNDDVFKLLTAIGFHPRGDGYDFKKELQLEAKIELLVIKMQLKGLGLLLQDNDDELKLSPAIEFNPRSDGYDFKKESSKKRALVVSIKKAGKKEDTTFHGLLPQDNDDEFKLSPAMKFHPRRDCYDFKKESSKIRAFVESIKKAGIKEDTTFHVSELMFQKSIGSLKVIGTTAFIVLFVFAMRIVNQKELMTETLPQSQTMTIASKELRSYFPTQVGDEVVRQCKMCINHSPAVAHCQTCQLNICTACNNLHKRVWTLLKHNVCPLNNI